MPRAEAGMEEPLDASVAWRRAELRAVSTAVCWARRRYDSITSAWACSTVSLASSSSRIVSAQLIALAASKHEVGETVEQLGSGSRQGDEIDSTLTSSRLARPGSSRAYEGQQGGR